MTIGFVTHGECERCGEELRDCQCPEPCANCGDTDADTFECGLCVNGEWLCSDCQQEHAETSQHRLRDMLQNHDRAVAKIQVMRADAEERYAEGCMNAFDDTYEAEAALGETVYDWAELVRDLIGE